MYRGTTPTLTFVLPFEANKLQKLSIAFAQKKTPYDKESTLVFEKQITQCGMKDNTITLVLSETDTLALDCHYDVDIQLRAAMNGKSMASDIYTVPVDRILKDGCLL